MQEVLTRKTIIILLAFVALLAVGTHVWLTWYGKEEAGNNTELPTINNQVEVKDPNSTDITVNTAFYDGVKFSPGVLNLSMEIGLGCVVNVVNQSGKGIRIGLSPHNPNGNDPGQNYAEIKPGESFLFDPRFTGFTELAFHDHGNSGAFFLTKFAESCQ